MKKKYKVWRDDYGETIDDADLFEHFEADGDTIAEEYGEFYHDERDGWECSWPIAFHVADEKGNYLGCFSVEREMRPHFYGRSIDGKDRRPDEVAECATKTS